MTIFRPANSNDLAELYAISLATGDMGRDASSLFNDPKLIGHIYCTPYVIHSPELCFVVEDEGGVAGYIVGAADTRVFEARLEAKWWPDLRHHYADPVNVPTDQRSIDQQFADAIHRPNVIPEDIVAVFPAHIHMNLLPRLQGKGLGSQLLQIWINAAKQHDIKAVHIGAGRDNSAGIRFWAKCGFQEINLRNNDPDTIWMGLTL